MRIHPRLFKEARKNGLLFLLTALASFLAGGIAVIQSYQLSRVISGVLIDQRTLKEVSSILLFILLLIFSRVVLTIISEALAGRMTIAIKQRLRAELLDKVNRLGPEFLKNEKTGELTTTALQGVDALDAYFSQYLPQVLISVALPLTILAVVFPMDLLTGIIFVFTLPLIPVFMVLIGWASEALTKRQWKALTYLGNYFLDTLQGIATLKMLGRSKERGNEVRDASERYRLATLAVLRVTFISALALELIATISTAVVAVEIGLRLLYGRIAFQQAFFILLIAPEYYLPLRNLSARYHAGMTGVTAAQKIFEILDVPEPARQPFLSIENLEQVFRTDYRLRVSNLYYSYPGMGSHSIQDISFCMQKGLHYALAGRSGSGKSTLARILLGLIEPQEGQIWVNGSQVQAYSLEDWRRFVGWLPQTPFIFNDTLFNNVTLRDTRFSTSDVERALRLAGLAQLLATLPLGLHTPLLEGGARFSGGQLQRVALARIFLRQPSLLVLDEPTSHLDPGLARALDDTFKTLLQDRTTLTIAHRLSTIAQADEVIFLKDGQIGAIGKHATLLETCPDYGAFIHGSGVLA
ncbi:MAG TPA: thiol reductant ABC exporter subunit CydD [Anaerolineaceae bacterium]|nr:thiol reductant ABC exporter subunit CydD [Anaerolineaceae bacterium]HPD62779.1 thiol reductant ABC exporter subunit CydD [Anaerolineaceae bacterium]